MEEMMNNSHRYGNKFILMLVGMLLLAGIVVVAILRDRIVNQQFRQITVNGQAKVPYQADMAKVNLGVKVEKVYQAEDALKQLNDKTKAIYQAILGAGVSKDDVITQDYSLFPEYNYSESISSLAGYTAQQNLTITVRDLGNDSELLSKVIDAATKAGATQINSVAFEVSNLKELKEQARLEAIVDARSKADKYAEALDVDLKEVAGWWENVINSPDSTNNYYYDAGGYGGAGMSAGKGSPVIPAGQQEIIIEANINYNID